MSFASLQKECLEEYKWLQDPKDVLNFCSESNIQARSSVPDFPVGLRSLPLFEPWHGVFDVVPVFTGTKKDLLHEPPPRTVSLPTKEELPVSSVQLIYASWQDWVAAGHALPADWNNYPTPIEYPSAETTPVPDTIVATDSGGSMDLGAIGGQLLDIGMSALEARLMPQPQQFIPGAIAAGGALSRAALPVAAGAAGALGVADLFGKKKRRRRRRLASVSDIKDLAALKAVLGNGEAFKTWIATHSR